MSSEDGRYHITDIKTGRKFLVEPIGNPHVNWGDVNPATKKLEGDYGDKYRGSIDEKNSIITEQNGFKNIIVGEIGESPVDLMNKILNS
jgi:hypothetical protein